MKSTTVPKKYLIIGIALLVVVTGVSLAGAGLFTQTTGGAPANSSPDTQASPREPVSSTTGADDLADPSDTSSPALTHKTGVANQAIKQTPGCTQKLPPQGVFTFSAPGRKPIRVFVDATTPSLRTARIIVVMHGMNRNAQDYRDAFSQLVKNKETVVIAPEFTDKDFPSSAGYAQGGMTTESGAPKQYGTWTFNYIEDLFDCVINKIGGSQRTYDMFGHSAGAQFVHRFVQFMPADIIRLRHAIAANAGWYTMPDVRNSYPYGLRNAPSAPKPATMFARSLTVLVGSEDVGEKNLRMTPQALGQGKTRLERGETFHQRAKDEAARTNSPFAWKLKHIPGVAHNYRHMSAAAMNILTDTQ